MNLRSADQESLFEIVLQKLAQLGYRDELIQRDWTFVDWFQPENPKRTLPAAAFGQTPQSYGSACFAVLLSNGKVGPELVADARALGAPYAFEIRPNLIINWRVGRNQTTCQELLQIEPSQIDRVFDGNREKWSAADVLRSKNIAFKLGPRQLDFIDLGLIPALEQQISTKLDRMLREVMQDATKRLGRHGPSDLRDLYRLIFRALAGKMLHDRGVNPFSQLESSDTDSLLKAVAAYYGDVQDPTIEDTSTRDLVMSAIWTLDFRNLSVEVLAYIYENTLIAKDSRKILGTHSTPHAVARYVVHHIPFERLPERERRTIEPFSGHGIFLVAALQRLRELLDPTVGTLERHRYFVNMLQGFEVEPFAVEVSKLCLMLADFPNHNGWQLKTKDVFRSPEFESVLRASNIVLSNPPFEDFTKEGRLDYSTLESVHKPAEFMNLVLRNLPTRGMLGVVLPRHFLDGRAYREIRADLHQRFASIEVLALPDDIFQNAQLETAVLIATEPRVGSGQRLFVKYTEVAKKDSAKFLREYAYTRTDDTGLTLARVRASLNIPRFADIWETLSPNPVLDQAVIIHRGLEWQAPFVEERYVSPIPKDGFEKGFDRVAGTLSFQAPPRSVYLSVRSEHRRGGSFELPWDKPKVLLNAARRSREGWWLSAFSDFSGHRASQRFHAIWPKEPWTPNAVAAILNSPVANAFVRSHEFQRNIRKNTVKSIPLPRVDRAFILTLDRMVMDYLRVLGDDPASTSQWQAAAQESAKSILLSIDAFVLRAYKLPPRMERELLDFFTGKQRFVPFPFDRYFPKDFEPFIPLWMYLSPEYERCNSTFLFAHLPQITDPDLVAVLEEVAE